MIGVITIIISIIIMAVSLSMNSEWFSVVSWYVPAALLIDYAASNTQFSKKVFSNRYIKAIGDISFEFFLIHQLCIKYIAVILNQVGISEVLVVVAIDFIISIIATFIWRKMFCFIKDMI